MAFSIVELVMGASQMFQITRLTCMAGGKDCIRINLSSL